MVKVKTAVTLLSATIRSLFPYVLYSERNISPLSLEEDNCHKTPTHPFPTSSPAPTLQAQEVPVEPKVAEFLHEGVVGVVRGIPVVHLLPLGQGLLTEQLHHLHGFGVRGPDDVAEDLGTQPGHAKGIAGNIGHLPRNSGHTQTDGPACKRKQESHSS